MANTFTPTTGLPDAKKHFNPLWLIAAVLIVILVALGILIFQNGAIKENTKPEEVRRQEAQQKAQQNAAIYRKKQEAIWAEIEKHLGDVDNVYGFAVAFLVHDESLENDAVPYYAPRYDIRADTIPGVDVGEYRRSEFDRIRYNRLSPPGHPLDKNNFDQSFLLLGTPNARANTIRKQMGQEEVKSRAGGKFEKANFDFPILKPEDKQFTFHTYIFTAKLTMVDGRVLHPRYQVVIAEDSGKYYLYPVKKASF